MVGGRGRSRPTGRPVQQPQGILAVALRVGTRLVQDLPLHFARGLAVASANGSEVLPYLCRPIVTLLPKCSAGLHCRQLDGSGYISKWLDGCLVVTLNTSRFGNALPTNPMVYSPKVKVSVLFGRTRHQNGIS